MGGQADESFLRIRIVRRSVASVEYIKYPVVGLSVADSVEYLYELAVALAVHRCQLYGDESGFFQCLAFKKIWRRIVLAHQIAVAVADHGRQLPQIADQ